MPENRDRTLTVIGSTSVGKSALTIRFIENKFSTEYDPTISRTYRHKLQGNGIDYYLTVNDTAGLERQAQIPQQYINSHGFILVYSIADRQSFEILSDIYNRLVDELLRTNVPLVLIGNKSDLNEQRRVTYEDGASLVQEWCDMGSQASFIETSALTGDKVEDVFVTLLKSIDQTSPSSSSNQQQNKQQNTNNGSNLRGNTSSNEKSGDQKKCIIS